MCSGWFKIAREWYELCKNWIDDTFGKGPSVEELKKRRKEQKARPSYLDELMGRRIKQ